MEEPDGEEEQELHHKCARPCKEEPLTEAELSVKNEKGIVTKIIRAKQGSHILWLWGREVTVWGYGAERLLYRVMGQRGQCMALWGRDVTVQRHWTERSLYPIHCMEAWGREVNVRSYRAEKTMYGVMGLRGYCREPLCREVTVWSHEAERSLCRHGAEKFLY